MDCEDAFGAVDAEDKVCSLWQLGLGLMKGDLSETVRKGGPAGDRAR